MRDTETEKQQKNQRQRVLTYLQQVHMYRSKATKEEPHTKQLELLAERLHELGVDDIDGELERIGADKIMSATGEEDDGDKPLFLCNNCGCVMGVGNGAVHWHCSECTDFDLCPVCPCCLCCFSPQKMLALVPAMTSTLNRNARRQVRTQRRDTSLCQRHRVSRRCSR